MTKTKELTRWIVTTLPLAPLAALVYIFSEWLFVVTKPSPTGSLPFTTQLAVLAGTPLPMLLPLLGIQAAASVLSVIGYPRLRGLAVVPSALILGTLVFLLVDNFTYTLFNVGVLSWGVVLRVPYVVLLGLLMATVGWKLAERAGRAVGRPRVTAGALVVVVLCASAPAAVGWLLAPPTPDLSAPPRTETGDAGDANGKLPNILLLGIDGVDDVLLSAYGAQRETTPFLQSIRDQTLFFENAFSNAAHTHGSIVTLLTGRLPFSTRVTFPPTVLQGEDAHRHLPGILKRLGYATLQIGMRHYVDAEDTNMLGAFDAANYRWQNLDDLEKAAKTSTETDTFRGAIAERFDLRVASLLGFGTVANGFAQIMGTENNPIWTDARRVDTLVRYFQTAPQPWFVHLHLLDTHCCFYHPSQMYFSGIDANQDAFDSVIREADANVRKLFAALAADGQLEHTIIVISSDHTSGWGTTGRVPLMIRFPNARYRGRVMTNVQLADVAPTLLAYLGVQIPTWMEGVSLLDPGRIPSRRIFAVSDITERNGSVPTDRFLLKSDPPNYGTAAVSMIDGSHWFELSLVNGSMRSGPVPGHTQPDSGGIPESEARSLIVERIGRDGFKVEGPAQK